MKRFAGALLIAALAMFAGPTASAQELSPEPFVELHLFDGITLEGDTPGDGIQMIIARRTSDIPLKVELKKSFMPQLRTTVADNALD